MRVADYVAPTSLDEATALLAQDGGRVLAGGNSLLVEPNRSRLATTKLVDLRRIPGLIGVQSSDGGVQIGAMTPLVSVADDATIRERYLALAEAIRVVGDAQVRNRATLAGSLADADPESDLPAVMIALGAQLQVQGTKGSRSLAAEELIRGPFQTSLAPGEVITAITLPTPAARTGSAYEKFKHPASLYAICGVAASVTLGADGTVSECRAAITGATEFVSRLRSVESALRGLRPDSAALAAAAEQGTGNLNFRGDRFASAEYRRHLTAVLTRRALARAAERAGS